MQVAHGGFGGLKFTAFSNDSGVIAYAFFPLRRPRTKIEWPGSHSGLDPQSTGPKEELIALEGELNQFANSLELIQPFQ